VDTISKYFQEVKGGKSGWVRRNDDSWQEYNGLLKYRSLNYFDKPSEVEEKTTFFLSDRKMHLFESVL